MNTSEFTSLIRFDICQFLIAAQRSSLTILSIWLLFNSLSSFLFFAVRVQRPLGTTLTKTVTVKKFRVHVSGVDESLAFTGHSLDEA